ncbi:MAG: glutaredoxin family protein [Polyangiales bacterium]
MRTSLLALALITGSITGSVGLVSPRAEAGSDLVLSQVTVYSATWCGPCKVLKAGLHEKNIPFEEVDVDQYPSSYAMAKKASGTNAIPLTNVVHGPKMSWIVGSDVDAVVRAYNGD